MEAFDNFFCRIDICALVIMNEVFLVINAVVGCFGLEEWRFCYIKATNIFKLGGKTIKQIVKIEH